jgi:hypothetical protein
MRWMVWCLLLLAGCGGAEKKKVDTESIRDHADQADHDLDKESAKSADK